jgi:excisionase family DNA binding protein
MGRVQDLTMNAKGRTPRDVSADGNGRAASNGRRLTRGTDRVRRRVPFRDGELTEIGRLFRAKLRQLEAAEVRRKPRVRTNHRTQLRIRLPAEAQQVADDELLRGQELAQFLNVHTKTVARWTTSAGLPSIRTPGGHRRYRWGDVRSWIAAANADGNDETSAPPAAAPA